MLCNRGTSRGPVSVRVSPSVTSRCSIETDERIELGFWRVSFLPPVLHCVKRKFGYPKKGTSLWNFVLNSECFLSGRGQGHVSNFYFVDFENFATAYRSSKRVINFA